MDENTDLGASKPVPQPVYKPQPVKNDTVVACQHKINIRRFPTHSNCYSCWEAFFEMNVEGLASVHALLMTDGTRAVKAIHGAKFVKYLGKYLQKKLLQQASPETQALSGIEGNIIDITGVSGGIRQESK